MFEQFKKEHDIVLFTRITFVSDYKYLLLMTLLLNMVVLFIFNKVLWCMYSSGNITILSKCRLLNSNMFMLLVKM